MNSFIGKVVVCSVVELSCIKLKDVSLDCTII